jgi:hypothetical protein
MSASSTPKPSQTAFRRDWWNTLCVSGIALWARRDHSAFFALRFARRWGPEIPLRCMAASSRGATPSRAASTRVPLSRTANVHRCRPSNGRTSRPSSDTRTLPLRGRREQVRSNRERDRTSRTPRTRLRWRHVGDGHLTCQKRVEIKGILVAGAGFEPATFGL